MPSLAAGCAGLKLLLLLALGATAGGGVAVAVTYGLGTMSAADIITGIEYSLGRTGRGMIPV